MAIYDNPTRRPTVADSPGRLYDSFGWGSDAAIYAINGEISSFDLYVLSVNSNGVTESQAYEQEFSTFYVRMHFDAGTGFVYTDDGWVINPANGKHVGNFQASGYMIPDSTLNQAFFLGQTQLQFGSNDFTIESFDLTTLAPISEMVVSNVEGNPLRFIRWGADGLAFNDDAGFVYLVEGTFVGGGDRQGRTPQRLLGPIRKTWSVSGSLQKQRARPQVALN